MKSKRISLRQSFLGTTKLYPSEIEKVTVHYKEKTVGEKGGNSCWARRDAGVSTRIKIELEKEEIPYVAARGERGPTRKWTWKDQRRWCFV